MRAPNPRFLVLLVAPGLWTCQTPAAVERAPGLQAPSVAAASPEPAAPLHEATAGERTWAEQVERPGLPNLHRVSPRLWRGAQPEAEGFRELERLGVHSVLSLRAFHADRLPDGCALERERIAFKAWHPEDEDVVRFLRFVSDPANQPVFVHCQWGADRTGMMCALWRVACCGWTKDEAIAEMTRGGFGFHPEWSNLVEYVRAADVERLAAEAGLPAR